MELTWMGHSCFVLESDGYRVALDPYTMSEYPALHVRAHRVLCSHGHFDHNFVEAVELLPERGSPFTVETVASFHDEKEGALRGGNTIHLLRAEGLCVAHCGDLGHELNETQLAALRGCDALLLPVGGYYTIDAPTAKRIADAVAPRVVVPMHYRHGEYGLRVIGGVEEFLRGYDVSDVHRLAVNRFTLTAETPRGVVVPAFAG